MVDALTVRLAVVEDAATIAVLLTELGYPATVDSAKAILQTALAGGEQAVFVAQREEMVVGLAALTRLFYFHLGQPIARLSSLVVSEAARGYGVGAQLLATAEQWAREQGCVQLELTSSVKRERAHAFYRRAGYSGSAYRFVRQLTGEAIAGENVTGENKTVR